MPATLRASATGEVFTLEDYSLIGRSSEATICLSDAGVSRQHAAIRRDGVHYWLTDLGSSNGSYVNDMALTSARVLRNGDRVRFGGSIFHFVQSGAGQAGDAGGAGMKTQVFLAEPAPLRHDAVTLFVADLKGFTLMSSRLSPEQVANLLREWYADCNAILKQHGASIDKFIGDCVFAYWHGTDPVIRASAVEAALALRAAEIGATSPTREFLKARMDIVLDCRIGLHLGDVAIGAMGRGINTALGDAVNIAFRIEGLTRKLDEPILASTAFLQGWEHGRDLFQSAGSHAVKGHPEMIEVFALRR
jgi:adenylate cyclase